MNTLFLVRSCDELPEEARQYLDIAEGELKRIAHITRQTLGFYRESTGPTTFSVNTLLDSVIDLLQSKLKTKRIIVEKQCDEHLELTGVFGELRQVFSNLLTNSLDAVGENGTVKLRASIAPFSNNGHRCVRVTVMDSGEGINAGALPHLFEPFFTTKGTIGNGLGLWVSKEILEKHRASIRVHSRTTGPYRGTTVSVIIPAEAA
jgi:signal transduction histidine kinase